MSQDNNWQQQVWQQPAAPQQPVAPAAPYGYAVQPPKTVSYTHLTLPTNSRV